MKSKHCTAGFFLFSLLLLFVISTLLIYRTEAFSSNVLHGKIYDALTQQGIRNATVQVWDTTLTSHGLWSLVCVNQTDLNGYYSINIGRNFQCRVYAFSDDPSSPGFDYLPAFRDIFLSGDSNLSFALKAGATLVIDGSFRFIESRKPADDSVFTVIDPNTGYLPSEVEYVYVYGARSRVHDFLGLGYNYVIVAAGTPFDVLINASFLDEGNTIFRTLRLSLGTPFVLEKGQETHVGVEESLFRYNFGVVNKNIQSTEKSLRDLEEKGFYVTLELQDLAKIGQLVDKAKAEQAKASYDEGYADLREGYLGTLELGKKLGDMYANVSSSVAILTFFTVLTVVALSSIMFERLISRVAGICGFSVLFLAALYFIYPGFRLVPTYSFVIEAGLGLGITFAIYLALLRVADQKLISIFSLGRQNLRRRRLRFVLTLISVMVLAMSFVTFTSFSTGYGLATRTFTASNPSSQGLLIRRPLQSGLSAVVTYFPLENSTIAWLQGKSEISGVAPKFENIPGFSRIGVLSSLTVASKSLEIFGILGFQPSTEAEVTHLNDTIISGRFLEDQEKNGILISRKAAESLNANIGDEFSLNTSLSNSMFSLIGIFDDNSYSLIKDIDLEPLAPEKMIMTIQPDGAPKIGVERCLPSETIIMNWQTSQEVFSAVSLSRVDVTISSQSSAPSLARQIALEQDLSVWFSFGGRISQVELGEYTEAKGLSVMIPWIIVVLNVIVTMLNSMFERRKEIGILSSIGLNPSHIGGIFLAEAAIIGVVGGGVGYFLGLAGYRGMLALSVAIEVRQKVSAFWSFASVGVAAAAVLVGTGIAIKSSVIITPSLLRKWSKEKWLEETGGQWEFQMPIRLHEDGVTALFRYLKERIPAYILSRYVGLDPNFVMKRMKDNETDTSVAHIRSLTFNYFFGQGDFLGSSPSTLIAEKKKGEETYSLKLLCPKIETTSVKKKVTFIRMMIVDWDAQRK